MEHWSLQPKRGTCRSQNASRPPHKPQCRHEQCTCGEECRRPLPAIGCAVAQKWAMGVAPRTHVALRDNLFWGSHWAGDGREGGPAGRGEGCGHGVEAFGLLCDMCCSSRWPCAASRGSRRDRRALVHQRSRTQTQPRRTCIRAAMGAVCTTGSSPRLQHRLLHLHLPAHASRARACLINFSCCPLSGHACTCVGAGGGPAGKAAPAARDRRQHAEVSPQRADTGTCAPAVRNVQC
jgi:hypothetical protein